jgi:hypothetical protein
MSAITDPIQAAQAHRHSGLEQVPLAPSVPGWDLLAANLGSNTTHGAWYRAPRDMYVAGIAWAMTAASGASTDPVDVGILDSTGATVLASSGSTQGKLNSTGRQTLNFASPVRLDGGTVYYPAISFGTVTTSPAALTADFGSGFGVELGGTGVGKWWGIIKTSAAPPLASMAAASRNGAPIALFLIEVGP